MWTYICCGQDIPADYWDLLGKGTLRSLAGLLKIRNPGLFSNSFFPLLKLPHFRGSFKMFK